MIERISCRDLNIEGCDFTASGETPGDVVKEVVRHLRAKHGIDMPSPDVILREDVPAESLEMADPGAVVIVERLREALDIVPSGEGSEARPSIGRTPTA